MYFQASCQPKPGRLLVESGRLPAEPWPAASCIPAGCQLNPGQVPAEPCSPDNTDNPEQRDSWTMQISREQPGQVDSPDRLAAEQLGFAAVNTRAPGFF